MDPERLIYIIKGCAKQDRTCQKVLYDTWYGHNLRITFRYVNTHEQAVEVTHQGFLNIFHNIHRLGVIDQEKISSLLTGWMKRMAITAAVESRKPELSLTAENHTAESHTAAPRSPETLPPSGQNIPAGDLITLVKQLPLTCHLVYNLHVIDDYSHVEIAALLGITPSASQAHLSSARFLLQNALSGLPHLSHRPKPCQ